MHRSWWLLLWIWSFIKALGLAVLCLTRKQPYHACCELALPWRSLLCLPGAWRARARLREQSKVSLKSLSALQAGRQQIKQWNDRKRAFLDQRGTVILSPLAKAHLRKRLMRRWGFALTSALIAFAWIVFLYWNVFRSVLSGASMYSHTLLPTDAALPSWSVPPLHRGRIPRELVSARRVRHGCWCSWWFPRSLRDMWRPPSLLVFFPVCAV